MYKPEVLQNAIDNYGDHFQMDQTTEECAELIVALNKIKRFLKGTEWENNKKIPTPGQVNSIKYSLLYFGVCSELADVTITIKEMTMVFNKSAVDLSVERKIDRLEETIKKTFGKNE